MADDLDIKELCDRAGVTPRTVHFYIQQGLLAPAGATGPGARYTVGHLDRLRLIRLLKKEHLPLAEIARRLRGLRDEDVRALLEERRNVRGARKGSALEYVRGVLLQGELLDHPADAARTHGTAFGSPLGAGSLQARSQWERIQLDDGIELHVRRPLTRHQQRLLDKLLAEVRRIFEEPDV